jgi:hypothetical protein
LKSILHSFAEKYFLKIKFLFIYITEAHADDEWPIGSSIQIKQPKTNQQRIYAVNQFIQATQWNQQLIPIYVDFIQNQFDEIYAAWPVRFYIMKQNQILHIAEPDNASYDMFDLQKKIEQAIGM